MSRAAPAAALALVGALVGGACVTLPALRSVVARTEGDVVIVADATVQDGDVDAARAAALDAAASQLQAIVQQSAPELPRDGDAVRASFDIARWRKDSEEARDWTPARVGVRRTIFGDQVRVVLPLAALVEEMRLLEPEARAALLGAARRHATEVRAGRTSLDGFAALAS